MQERIERSAAFGKIERGKSFDMADDSFGHIVALSSSLYVDQRH